MEFASLGLTCRRKETGSEGNRLRKPFKKRGVYGRQVIPVAQKGGGGGTEAI